MKGKHISKKTARRNNPDRTRTNVEANKPSQVAQVFNLRNKGNGKVDPFKVERFVRAHKKAKKAGTILPVANEEMTLEFRAEIHEAARLFDSIMGAANPDEAAKLYLGAGFDIEDI
jgi:hypothetical protein